MIKKIIYGTAWSLLGTETLIFSTQFYKLFKSNEMLTFSGGWGVAPYWLIIEGTMIGFAPILTKYFLKALKNEGLSDESELVGLIKRINKKKEKANGIK